MSTSKDLTTKYVRSFFMVRFESVMVKCYILDAKSAWGKDTVLASPVAGDGEQWVSVDRLGDRLEDAA